MRVLLFFGSVFMTVIVMNDLVVTQRLSRWGFMLIYTLISVYCIDSAWKEDELSKPALLWSLWLLASAGYFLNS